MRPISRHSVSKSKSSKSFRHNTSKVKSPNVQAPMRGGWRF